MDEEAVEQVQIRIRMAKCEDDDRLVDIGHRRSDQLIFPWQDAYDGALSLLLRILYRFDLRIIADERLLVPVPEDALRAALIVALRGMDIVEATDALINFTF